MFLETIESEGLAHLSYLLGDASAGVCAVIDPRRDVETYLERALRRQVRITHILETHIHADFVSGSRELAARTGAPIHVGAADAYGFEHRPLRDGDELRVGGVTLRVIHTPGHTPEHVCYLAGGGRGAEEPWGLFSGDTLFAGEVGRPDLLGEESAEPLARALHHSLHHKLLPLGDGVTVHPAHGRGSPCGARIGDRTQTTIGYERLHNPRLRIDDVDAFAREVLETAPPAPFYYARMKRINAEGPRVLGLPQPVPALRPEAFRREAEEDDTLVLDAREIDAFGGAHIAGALNIALRPAFPIWAGWMLPPDRRLLLVLARPDELDTVRRHLLRVGCERVAGFLAGGMPGWIEAGLPFAQTPQMSVHELRRRVEEGDGLQVLDVRSRAEWEAGHVPGARHVFAPHLPDHLDALDRGRPIATYCSSGFRAGIAASVLERHGFRDVRNVPGSMLAWEAVGYPLETPDRAGGEPGP